MWVFTVVHRRVTSSASLSRLGSLVPIFPRKQHGLRPPALPADNYRDGTFIQSIWKFQEYNKKFSYTCLAFQSQR